MKTINFKRLSDTATTPTRAHPDDAGIDLYCAKKLGYSPGQMIAVETHVAFGIPPGYVGIVRDRSSTSKRKLKVTAGIIDAGYTGEVVVCMLNLSGEYGHINKGDKIAQLLIVPVATPALNEVASLEDSARGSKGFGSSGG